MPPDLRSRGLDILIGIHKRFFNLNQRTYLQGVFIIITRLTTVSFIRGGGALGYSVRIASGTLGVRIPAATYLSRKNR